MVIGTVNHDYEMAMTWNRAALLLLLLSGVSQILAGWLRGSSSSVEA